MANEGQQTNSGNNEIGPITKDTLNTEGVMNYHRRLILAFLILKATYRQTVTYDDINEHLEQRGMNWIREPTEDIAYQELTEYLTDIFHWCIARNQPHLTSLVVRKSGANKGIPGKGFWDLLESNDELYSRLLSSGETKPVLTKFFQAKVFEYYGI